MADRELDAPCSVQGISKQITLLLCLYVVLNQGQGVINQGVGWLYRVCED